MIISIRIGDVGTYIMRWLKKVSGLLLQDVADANETKKVAIIIRMKSLIMSLYFLMQIISFALDRLYPMAILALVFLVGHGIAFAATYSCKSKNVVIYVQLLTLSWILLFVVMLGWDCGAQHFLFVLLVFMLLATFRNVIYKVIFALVLCATRIGLYEYCRYNQPYYPSELYSGPMFQFLNSFFVFASITCVVIMFSQNSIIMEKKLVDYNEKIRRMASVDPLTQLFNRRYALTYIEKLSSQINTQTDMFNIAIGDIDFFKKVNDTYGHEAGDVVLKKIADIIGNYMKKRGIVARWGGEEFLLVFEGINGDEAALALEDLRDRIAKTKIFYGEQELRVTMTFGIEEYDFKAGIDKIINEADKKLYMGKEAGRNRVVF